MKVDAPSISLETNFVRESDTSARQIDRRIFAGPVQVLSVQSERLLIAGPELKARFAQHLRLTTQSFEKDCSSSHNIEKIIQKRLDS